MWVKLEDYEYSGMEQGYMKRTKAFFERKGSMGLDVLVTYLILPGHTGPGGPTYSIISNCCLSLGSLSGLAIVSHICLQLQFQSQCFHLFFFFFGPEDQTHIHTIARQVLMLPSKIPSPCLLFFLFFSP